VVKSAIRPSVFVIVQMKELDKLRELLWAALEDVDVSRPTVAFLEEYLFRVAGEKLPATQLAHIWQDLYRNSVILEGQKLNPSFAKIEPLFDGVVKAIVIDNAEARKQATEYHKLLLTLAAEKSDRMAVVTS
jgi:hypothetical protein